MAALLVILAGISWGLLGVFLRQLLAADITPMEVCALRNGGTAIILGIVLGVWRPRLLRIRWRDLWCFLGGGCISVLLFNYCYFLTLQRTSIGIAVILLYTSPIFIAILSRILFQEPFTRQKSLALLMMFAGCALVSGIAEGKPTLSPAGILIGLASGFCYALYTIFGRFAQKRGYSTASITFWNFLCAALASCALPRWDFIAHAFGQQPMLWLWCTALVGISTILPYCCYTAGLARMEASRAAVLVAIEPLVATLAGIVFYHERLSLAVIGGIILVLTAILVLQMPRKTP
ncbi:MAG: EamA family transporter [Victivallales bacterium]|nr:EamA family transporter [Victivallales bacterium]